MKPEFEVQLLRREDYEEWNEFVKVHKNATIFHTVEWKKVLEETFGCKPEYLVVKNSEGKLVGVSPAFSVKTLFGKVIVSQPFFEYGGPIVEKGFEEAYNGILNFYKDKVENDRTKYVEIRILPDGEKEPEHFDNTGFVKQFKAYDFYIDVKGKDFEKDIWLGLSQKNQGLEIRLRKL